MSIQPRSKYRIIANPILKFSLLVAEFHMIISPKMAPKPYTETLISKNIKALCWKSSYPNSSYQKYRTSEPYRTQESRIPYRTSTNVDASKYFTYLLVQLQHNQNRVNNPHNSIFSVRKHENKPRTYLSRIVHKSLNHRFKY